MKTRSSLKYLAAGLSIFMAILTVQGRAQVVARFPDGREIYKDGSVRLPDGQIVRYPKGTATGNGQYPQNGTVQNDGRVIYPDGTIVYPDGRVVYPNGTVKYPTSRNNRRTQNDRRNGNWIPPGQAKKMYGGKSARDYAPGHNKNRNHDEDGDNDNGNWKKQNGKEKKNKKWKD